MSNWNHRHRSSFAVHHLDACSSPGVLAGVAAEVLGALAAVAKEKAAALEAGAGALANESAAPEAGADWPKLNPEVLAGAGVAAAAPARHRMHLGKLHHWYTLVRASKLRLAMLLQGTVLDMTTIRFRKLNVRMASHWEGKL